MTARDLIDSSARLLGILASGESLSADEATNALSSLNDMLDSWSTESLLINAKTEESFTLVGGQQTYTMGPTGNFNTTRPQSIENALLRMVSGSDTLDLPIEIFNKDLWANIASKATQSSIPTKLYAEGTYPLETINLWPVPNTANTLVLFSWKPLLNIATLNTAIDLPKGYSKALKYNFALELAPEYGKPIDPWIEVQARDSKANIKRMNSKPIYLGVDEALSVQNRRVNILTGE